MIAGIRGVIVGSMIALASLPARAEAAGDRTVEIGGGVGAIGSQWAGRFFGGDVRLSIPVNDRGDVEALVAVQAPRRNDTFGFYGVQYKQRLRPSTASGFQPFLSYGSIGVFYFEDGDRMITAPLVGLVGGGLEQRVNRRLSVRVEAQAITLFVIPVGMRVAAGVSVPIGGTSR